MKSKLLFTAVFLGSLLHAQPVIQSGNSRPAVGFATPVSLSVTMTNPGSSGANQNWDYSSLSYNTLGTVTVIDFVTSPHANYFAGANYAMAFNVGGTMLYTYQNYSSTKMEELAATVNGPGAEHDYTPNPPTRLVFPMSFGTSVSDTWQKINRGVNSVTITYDAYGSFKTPYHTYSNVVRVANDYGGGEIDYSWFTTSPLRLLAVHRHSDNNLVLLDGANVDLTENSLKNDISVYPNPATQRINVDLIDPAGLRTQFVLMDLTGSVVREMSLSADKNSLNREGLTSGVYLFQVWNETGILQSGKLILN